MNFPFVPYYGGIARAYAIHVDWSVPDKAKRETPCITEGDCPSEAKERRVAAPALGIPSSHWNPIPNITRRQENPYVVYMYTDSTCSSPADFIASGQDTPNTCNPIGIGVGSSNMAANPSGSVI